MLKPDYTLYLVTDTPESYAGGIKGLLASVDAAVAGGVTIVQFRADAGTKRALYDYAVALRDLLRQRKVPLIVNDHVDLALAVESEGVHIGQSDLPAAQVRRIIGKNMLLGLSTSNEAQIRAVDAGIVDYIGIGPVFPTVSKHNAPPAIGIAGIAKLAPLAPVPAVAIGGITPANAPEILASDIAGVAVVSAFSKAADPKAVAEMFRKIR